MKPSRKQNLRYLVKVTGRKDPLTIRKWNPDFWFLSENYRTDKATGNPIQIFKSRKEAVEAIKKERRMLKSELKQYQKDIRLLKVNGLLRRYVGLEGFLMRQSNGYIFWQNELKYEVVEVDIEQLKSVFGDGIVKS